MSAVDRRTFLKLLGAPAVAAALPLNLERAMAIPANNKTGTIRDVEHVVFLMQENRSFDHYFGTLRGVRGFAEPHPLRLESGASVWHQPHGQDELLPFRPKVRDAGKVFLPDPPHGWNDTHAAWNDGRFDRWVANKGVTTMTHHLRSDLPYQYALADAFTVCDNYFCSLLGPTDPNRYHMWSGWVGNDGRGGGPVIDNAEAGYRWGTYPERLQRAGIPWKVYQDIGEGLDAKHSWGWTSDPFIGNYGDNSLLYFDVFREAEGGTPLARRAKTGTEVRKHGRDPGHLLTDFRADVAAGRLPSVSWIVAPEAYSEHPNWEPDFGAWYMSQVVDILLSNADVWSKTVLFVMYDEEGGHFDHVMPPTPPQRRAEGLSTVDVTEELFAGDHDYRAGPYGLGIRVPMIVVSPWSRGGWVNSQVFDHTSLIRFLEARFADRHAGLVESNITAWRRAVSGDLTSAFDFENPNTGRRPRLPDTSDFEPRRLRRHSDDVPVPPEDQQVPEQEQGVRPARALPYTLHADGGMRDGALHVRFASLGEAAAVFHVRTAGGTTPPRTYTVGPGRELADTWDAEDGYDCFVHGPNGFFRRFRGDASTALTVAVTYPERSKRVVLTMHNGGDSPLRVDTHDAYGSEPRTLTVAAGGTTRQSWRLQASGGWYGLTVRADDAAHTVVTCAGHVEDGAASISDPLMGGLIDAADLPSAETAAG